MSSILIYVFVIISCVNACIKMVPPDMEGMPVTDMPVTNAPVTNEPVTNEPVTSEPVTDEPITDAPVTDEPVTDEPVTDEPVTDEPVTDEPITDEPVTDAPVTDAPGDCTTCEISSLCNEDYLNSDQVYFPPDQYIIDESDTCKKYRIACRVVGNSVLVIKEVDGGITTFDSFDAIYGITCDTDGKFLLNLDKKIEALWCKIAENEVSTPRIF